MAAASGGISIVDGDLMVLGTSILSGVPDNIILAPFAGDGPNAGAFVSVRCEAVQIGNRAVFPIGKLDGLRFVCYHKSQLGRSTKMSSHGRKIPSGTVSLIVEGVDRSHGEVTDCSIDDSRVVYTVFQPDTSIRVLLQGNESSNELEMCLESDKERLGTTSLVLITAGLNPFDVITYSLETMIKSWGKNVSYERQRVPDAFNWFGWSTMGVFYTDTNATKINALQSLHESGTPPKFLIIDRIEQWPGLDTVRTTSNDNCLVNRLTHMMKEHYPQTNSKDREKDHIKKLAQLVAKIKEEYDLKYAYVWHAITDDWVGVRPDESEITSFVSSTGVQSNAQDDNLHSSAINTSELLNPEKISIFYNKLHSYFASAGIDGIIVDILNILTKLKARFGEGVNYGKLYLKALEGLVKQNDPNNGIDCRIGFKHRFHFHRKSEGPVNSECDVISYMLGFYANVLFGELTSPQWDFFSSLHPMAEFHGAALAVGGHVICVSDKPGNHNFHLLKKMVLPDGSILRAKHLGRPTRDCLFLPLLHERKCLLKVWNLNEYSGVLGIFKLPTMDCQNDEEEPRTWTKVLSSDVECLSRVAGKCWNGDSILYLHLAGVVLYQIKNDFWLVTLKPGHYEVITVVPVEELKGVYVAPIGLIHMFNSGGAIKELKYEAAKRRLVRMKVRGSGAFGVYASVRPKTVTISRGRRKRGRPGRLTEELEENEIVYDEDSRLVTFTLGVPDEELYLWNIVMEF